MAYRKFLPEGKDPSHVTVVPRRGEHPDRTIKRFLKKVKKSSILEELRERRFYEKPSAKRRKKKKRREKVLRKLAEKQNAI